MSKIVALDIETACTVPGCPDHAKAICRNGHSLNPWQSRITSVGLVSNHGLKVVYRDLKDVKRFIGEHPTAFYIGQSFKFDLLHLYANGVKVPLESWIGDTNLMSYVLSEKIPDTWLADYERNKPSGVRKGSKHSLKTLAPYFLGVEPYWETLGHHSDEYVLKDVEYTLALYYVLEEKLKERGEFDFYHNRLLPWTKMLLEAEIRGVEFDIEGMNALKGSLEQKAAELRLKLDTMWEDAHRAYRNSQLTELSAKYEGMALKAGKPFNYGSRYFKLYEAARQKVPSGLDYDSPAQMAWLLRDYYGYDITSLDGSETTGREVLERLAEEGHEDVKTYLELRSANKILTAFLPTYAELVESRNGQPTLHPIYNVTSTRTGRTSSERPNCQQVPPKLRHLFRARSGYSFIGYDAAAIEARLIAAYTEDPTLYSIIASGTSIHDYNTINFLGLDANPSDVKKQYANERSGTKNVGFALFYNAGANRIRIAYAQKGIHLSQSECKQIHERFKSTYSTAYQYATGVVRHLERGEKIENLLGRPLIIENPDDAYMQGFNMLIQSSASDLNLHGAYEAYVTLKAANIDATPLLFVHDFVCFEVRDDQVEQANDIIKTCLTNVKLPTSNGVIPLEVDGGISKCWEK